MDGQLTKTPTSKIDQGIGFAVDAATLAAQIDRLGQVAALAMPLLDEPTRRRFLLEADKLTYRRARSTVGEGANAVHQDFELCYDIPAESPFHALAEAFQSLTLVAMESLPSPPFGRTFCYNDRIVQRYNPGEEGITPHRDHIAYECLVALIILENGGHFLTCAARDGLDAEEVHCPLGGVILMRGPGYADRRDRPFHLLRDIDRPRISYGLRYDIRK
ncbi:MAG: hypothetical protein AAF530_08610 [Pseudomonadota bacterium]